MKIVSTAGDLVEMNAAGLRLIEAEDFDAIRGMRIAQLVVAPVHQATWVVVEGLEATPRGEGGFGSTGR